MPACMVSSSQSTASQRLCRTQALAAALKAGATGVMRDLRARMRSTLKVCKSKHFHNASLMTFPIDIPKLATHADAHQCTSACCCEVQIHCRGSTQHLCIVDSVDSANVHTAPVPYAPTRDV
eukprot:1035586-Amphidinium_carterae.2